MSLTVRMGHHESVEDSAGTVLYDGPDAYLWALRHHSNAKIRFSWEQGQPLPRERW